MDEPTDRALKLQGLKRAEYDSMSQEGKAVVASRSRRLTEIADISLAAELLNTLAEADESSKAYIAEALEGKHPAFNENIRLLIDEYLDAMVDTSIKDYYKIRYAGKNGILAESIDGETADIRPPREEISSVAQSIDTKIEAAASAKPPEASQPAADAEPATAPIPEDPLIRSRKIAVILSRWEKRDVDRIMKSESDIISTIMTITDQSQADGITDEIVCKAAETMIKNGTNGIQFYAEAISPVNRELLIETAKAFKQP
ncbi:MAG: hypothetical protein V1875_06795 [Candidatus Altiarchaeota archaeon]